LLRVLTMRELRQGLSDVVDEVLTGGPVFAGSHRRPEVVLMSVRSYERLTAAQERAVESATASMQMEGLPPSTVELEAARELAAGRIEFAEYRRRVGV
jgi:prevent-host-death family protein